MRISGIESNSEIAEQVKIAEKRDATTNMVAQLASMLHDDWRADRKNSDGSYNPRPKWLILRNGQEEWVNPNNIEEDDVIKKAQDIANTNFVDLDPHWQAENKAAAEVAVKLIRKAAISGEKIDTPDFIERASAQVHIEWLRRNLGPWTPQDQTLPYDQLSEENKKLDRQQVSLAIKVYRQHRQK